MTLLEAVVESNASAEELLDPVASAEAAGLRYVSDHTAGIRRKKDGEGFTYVKPDGEKVSDERTLVRIKSLAIPPAWTDVWICPSANGHIQATGRDAKGRKQYRYHPRWREVRDAVKYDKMLDFARALPRIRKRVEQDLSRPGMPREKVLAAVVKLLEQTKIRVGNGEYAAQNKSYGLTTLQDRHVKVEGTTLRFKFKGKSGKEHEVELQDRRLAKIVRACRDLPGQELFQYVDEEGVRRDVTSGDVNAYIREIAGEEFSAKDFRTWAGTVLAARFLRECERCETESEGKKVLVRCIEAVAAELGNTVAVCRKCYVHPAVLEAYMGDGLAALKPRKTKALYLLDEEEAALVELLRAGEAAPAKAA
ncbi:MAG TPA: DNA topoisomerase IB [Chloroflexota bacterium]|nr:DNA topoisomerase IB [Chloroflexota bacterium]